MAGRLGCVNTRYYYQRGGIWKHSVLSAALHEISQTNQLLAVADASDLTIKTYDFWAGDDFGPQGRANTYTGKDWGNWFWQTDDSNLSYFLGPMFAQRTPMIAQRHLISRFALAARYVASRYAWDVQLRADAPSLGAPLEVVQLQLDAPPNLPPPPRPAGKFAFE
jgi:hypothetical protein